MDSSRPGTGKASVDIPDIRTLNVLYTNDIEGNTEQMPYLSSVVKQSREKEPFTILVDSGNWAKGDFLSDSFKGMPMVEIMNVIKYDAVNTGESEISLGEKELFKLHEKASFPLLSCNIIMSATGKTPDFIRKYAIFNKGPFKIAVIGVSFPGNYEKKGFVVQDPFTMLPETFSEVEDHKTDVVILLSRMGIEVDRELARKFPQTNVIIGGRDKKFIDPPITQGQTVICQAGEKAKYLGTISLDMRMTFRVTSTE
jgi:5'-nucleotidase